MLIIEQNGKKRVIRSKLYLIVDTETFGGFIKPICYDVGLAVIDNKGRIYAKYSFVVHDTFIGMKEQAATAYYSNKFPQYEEDIRNKKRIITSFAMIKKVANKLLEKWHIKDVVAHNAVFDCKSLNNTTKVLGLGNSFFDYYVEWWDTLQMCADTICKQKLYIRFCQENGFMTKERISRPQMKAEVIYRYIINDTTFNESHTGLEDVLIEAQIFAKCFAQHKKMRHTFYVRSQS